MSDSNMRPPGGLVIGTAGHIDHGKTSLVRALTGMETDRLEEEKRRGISIDLGFAHLTLADGRRISFIDVPGHERFIKNMLAGAAGIEAVLLVVAADESVKPQTREHFEICRLLGIEHGLVVLTKIDLPSAEQIARATRDIEALCASSFLAGAPIVPVSAMTGEGIAALKEAIANLADNVAPRESTGLMRLPIDRSFALKGFGTVVTGTMWNGALRVADTVEIYPAKQVARVRGLQVHGTQVSTAAAGQRTAVNLSGVDHDEIRRGFVLAARGELDSSKLLDVSIQWLETDIPMRRTQVLFHCGTAETPAWLKVLERGDAGNPSFARLWLTDPILALPGDRFVLRRPSPAQTIAGGKIVDAFPPARLNRNRTIARLHALAEGGLAKRIEILVQESSNGRRIGDLVRMTAMPADLLKALIQGNSALVLIESAQRVVTKLWIEKARERILRFLSEFHAKNPAALGAPVALARLNLDASLAAAVFDGFSGVRITGDMVALATHKAQVNAEDTQALLRMEQAFRQAGVQPPLASEVLRSAGADAKKNRGLLEALIKTQKLVRVSEDLIFHADVLAHIRKLLASHKGGRFSVPEFKEWTQVSRKYAIPLLEYLDRQHVTRREGDARVVL